MQVFSLNALKNVNQSTKSSSFFFFWQIKKVADVHRKGILSVSVAH